MRTASVALALLLCGCAVADEYYEKGRAWEGRSASAAAEYYRLALAEDPNHPGARERVTGFDFYGALLSEARGFEERGEWEWALRTYDRVAEVGFVVKAMNGPTPPAFLETRRVEAMRNAAAARFAEGERARAGGDHAAATRAFRESMALDPTNPQVQAAYKDAKAKALRRLGVLPFAGDSPDTTQLGRALADAVNADVDRRRPELIELVTRTHLDQVLDEHDLNAATVIIDPATAAKSGKLMGLHVLVTGTLTLEKNDTGWTEQPGQATKEVKDNDQVVKTLSASWVVRTRATTAALVVSLQVIDVETGAVLVADRVRRSRTAEAKYARKVSGDDGALPADVAGWCNNADAPPATPEALAKDLVTAVAEAAGKAIVERLE